MAPGSSCQSTIDGSERITNQLPCPFDGTTLKYIQHFLPEFPKELEPGWPEAVTFSTAYLSSLPCLPCLLPTPTSVLPESSPKQTTQILVSGAASRRIQA